MIPAEHLHPAAPIFCDWSSCDNWHLSECLSVYVASKGRHFYTALEYERDLIIGDQDFTDAGWTYEGKTFLGYTTSDYPDDAVAVVRYLNQESGNHVYSPSTYEQSLLNADSNWLNEGIAW